MSAWPGWLPRPSRPSRSRRPLRSWSRACLAVVAVAVAAVAHPAHATSHSVRWSRAFQQSDGHRPSFRQSFEDDKQGYLGCLISDSLCNSEETCFDDNIFGRCISPEKEDAANANQQQKMWPLSSGDLSLIAFESERLRANGFELSDIYSQCVLENVVAAIELNAAFSDSACSLFLPASDEADFAEEVDDGADELVPEQIITDIEERSVVPKKMAEQSLASPLFAEPELVRVREDQDGAIVIEPNQEELFNSYLSAAADDEDNLADIDNLYDQQTIGENEDLLHVVLPELLVSPSDDFSDDVTNDVRKLRKRSDVISYNNDDAIDNNIGQDSEEGPAHDLLVPLDVAWSVDNDYDDSDGENGDLLVYVPRDSSSDSNGEDSEGESEGEGEGEEVVLADSGLESNIFNRHERLDVKKPGPFFKNSANNFFLDKLLSSDYDQSTQDDHYEYSDGASRNGTEGQAEYELPLLAAEKRDLPLGRESPESQHYKLVHINTKNRLSTWRQGSDLIDFLAHEFGLPEHALVDRKIDSHHVQFGVASNPQSVTAEEMAKALGADIALRKRIDQHVGLRVDQAAAAPSTSDISSVFPTGSNLNQLLAVVVFASATAVLLVLGVILLLVVAKRRRTAATDKLRKHDIDAEEKDKAQEEYKQLCRDWSRSSKKSESGKHNSAAAVVPTSIKKQIQNKESRESEGSNRSSTSSWCEEPNSTNMDISTGHMVLAYMEDHLKNKQRLEQEWVSLCGYEAEPCATTIAFKPENKKKNRYPDKLPYDHNRVILNAMVNANNSDYINASTVTDHDPRNPSYIVCQGPMGTTVADFWQMIWEQGCVVIVMLTKLQDTNAHQMSHRYWPQEGSEQYHIFEVHLVSEHIWCDDYLVRSVYLKNTRTGETRTVTQFHFMSWPEHGVPTSTKALLEFRRKVNKSYRGRSAPICVHCSDGVGRSGTYVLIDMVLSRMAKGCKEIDIAATLEHVRDQRGGMVATRHQFEFCLTAVAEEVHAILKAMPQ